MRITTVQRLALLGVLSVAVVYGNRSLVPVAHAAPTQDQGTQGQGAERAEKAPVSSEAEVMSAAMAINTGEIKMAGLAKKKAKSNAVKKLASTIMDDHQKSKAKLRDVQKASKIQPKKNDVTSELEAAVSKKMTMLNGASGDAFDREYVQTQIELHRHALDVITTRLMPAVKNDQLRTAMTTLRGNVEEHVDASQDVMKKLNATAGVGTTRANDQKAKSGENEKKKDK